jgi:hypothetical protein
MLQRLEDALPRKAVQAPEQHHVEIPLRVRRGLHHRLKLRPVSILARLLIDVLPDDRQAFLLGELPQLDQLVLGVLAAVFGRDPRGT